jgi:hypothetical protein
MSRENLNVSDSTLAVQTLYIVLAGRPSCGFAAFGPYDTEAEAKAICALAWDKYQGTDWDVFPLARPAPCPAERNAEQWREEDEAWIRFSSPNIDCRWKFTGPFAQDRPPWQMMQLRPLLFPAIDRLIADTIAAAEAAPNGRV